MACGEVAPANSNVNINANTAYKIYPPATSTEVSAAAAVAGRIAATLPVIDGDPPVTDASVLLRLTKALHGLVPASAIQASSLAADIPSGIGYGVSVPDTQSGGCVHGWASVHGSGETVERSESRRWLPSATGTLRVAHRERRDGRHTRAQ